MGPRGHHWWLLEPWTLSRSSSSQHSCWETGKSKEPQINTRQPHTDTQVHIVAHGGVEIKLKKKKLSRAGQFRSTGVYFGLIGENGLPKV